MSAGSPSGPQCQPGAIQLPPRMSMESPKNRIEYLDGLRGVAILAVVLFHAYVRWPAALGQGAPLSVIPMLSEGQMGVYLFFIISGFVILMTLERTPKFPQFLYRRWLRLFPAMLVVSVIVYATAKPLFPERPAGIPVLRDLLPGLTFINGSVWERYIFHSPQGLLEGAFWTLFVEVEFYVLFGLAYYGLGANWAIATLLGLCVAHAARVPLLWRFPFLAYLGWFAVGALFYRYHTTRRRLWFASGVVTGLTSALVLLKGTAQVKAVAVLIVALFAASVVNSRIQRVIGTRALVFLGFVSYPLYLVHENMMVALIVKLHRLFPGIPGMVLPILPIVIVVGVSYLVARYAELVARQMILRIIPGGGTT